MYVTMTFCLVFVVVYAVLGYIYSHNEDSKPVLICKHCLNYCNFKSLRVAMYSLHGLFLRSLYVATEIDKTNVSLYTGSR